MGWKKTENVAQYKKADWDNFIKKEANCTPAQAQRIALKDPNISFFFFCRESMILEGPVYEKYGAFNPGDAIFFSGEPWYGSAPQCDGYVKTGITVAYISPESDAQFAEIGNYTLADGSPAIDVVCIFAASYTSTELPYLRANNNQPPTKKPFNPNIQSVLSNKIVPQLQKLGITVLLTVLNGWTKVGWSEFTTQSEAKKFAAYLKNDVVEKYGLDGIDIDDEYTSGVPNHQSLIMVTSEIKSLMPDKIITKALLNDKDQFQATYNGIKLVDNLTYGWQMSYYGGNANLRLKKYVGYGMKKEQLCLGFSAEPGFASHWNTIASGTKNTMQEGYAGVMLFDYQNQPRSHILMKEMVNTINGQGNWNGT